MVGGGKIFGGFGLGTHVQEHFHQPVHAVGLGPALAIFLFQAQNVFYIDRIEFSRLVDVCLGKRRLFVGCQIDVLDEFKKLRQHHGGIKVVVHGLLALNGHAFEELRHGGRSLRQ